MNKAIFVAGAPFNANFDVATKKMAKYLWHSLGHLYTKHWDELGKHSE